MTSHRSHLNLQTLTLLSPKSFLGGWQIFRRHPRPEMRIILSFSTRLRTLPIRTVKTIRLEEVTKLREIFLESSNESLNSETNRD
jgi:hypothetical protein